MNNYDDHLSTFEWWTRQLLRYNVSLVIAGILAFICYVGVICSNTDIIPDADITLFTTLFQGVGYLFMMGIANICFLAGPISEKLLKPKNIGFYRKITYRFGYWFSVLLPFSIPALLLFFVLFYPEYWADS